MQTHLDVEGPFNSRRIKEYLRQQQLTSTTPKVPPPINPHQIPLPETPPHPGSLGLPQGGTPSPTPHQSPGLGRPRFGDQPDYGFGNQNEFENDIGNDLDYNGGNDYGSGLNRALANLAKMYKEKLQYGGENDNFDFKLTIFRDLCKRAGILSTARNLAYPTMLRDLALEHYYINLNNTSEIPPFEELCDKTRNYFEGPEYRRSILGQWEALTIKTVIARTENSSKTTLDCLKLLITELRHLQLGLDLELRTEKLLRNKLISACQTLTACQYACYRPSDNLAGLIEDLRSSITTYEKTNGGNNNAFFTDRRYYKQNSFSRPAQPTPTPYRNPLFRQNNRISYPTNKTCPNPTGGQGNKKLCFVCGQEGCWSTKHTKQERDESTRDIRNRYKKIERQYIIDHEGTEDCETENCDPDCESVTGAIETLILDTDTPEIPNEDEAEHFFTSLGPLPKNEATNITKDLANRSFTHAITGTIPIIEPTPNNSDPATGFTTPEAPDADPFSYITSDRYTADTFYGIMIDTGASKRSRAGYGQFLAYSKTHTTTLDTARAGLVNVQFGIGSACSIGSVTVKTPVGTVEFHVVQADTPFLLCLSDMDSLRVYYNNLTNTLITPTESVPVVRRFGHPFLLWEDSL